MKGLLNIPDLSQLEQAYHQIQFEPLRLLPKDYVLYSQWSRFDPRVAELLIKAIDSQWQKISPLELNQCLKQAPWPAAFGVFLEQVNDELTITKKSKDQILLFRAWANLVMSGIQIPDHGLYFIGLRRFGGKLMQEDAQKTSRAYKKWGFLGYERFFSHKKTSAQTLMAKSVRQHILDSLIKSSVRVSVEDYLRVLDHQVSRRQAQRDLAACGRLKAVSRTRGRFYRRP